ncbi:hypothetical protein SETIT_7G001900v2 [Setaria italica]|uniref:Uncharacterized protein n=1 Tax=Setaria italica TaxID=4555 RepID=K3YB23_SETIT|nr:hypothetical protein SETIT_7G001900v2 [Setaria italica]
MVCFLQATEGSLHFSIDTMSGTYPIDHYLSLLKVGGMMVLLSFPSEIKVQAANLNLSSVTGGTKDIEEMINFWAATKIYPERLIDQDDRYPFVVDRESFQVLKL